MTMYHVPFWELERHMDTGEWVQLMAVITEEQNMRAQANRANKWR